MSKILKAEKKAIDNAIKTIVSGWNNITPGMAREALWECVTAPKALAITNIQAVFRGHDVEIERKDAFAIRRVFYLAGLLYPEFGTFKGPIKR